MGRIWAAKGDPLAHLNGQRTFALEVAEFAHRNGSTQIIAPDYATASMLRFYAPQDMTVTHITDKLRYAGFATVPVTLPAVVVTRGSSPVPDRIAQRYRIGTPAASAMNLLPSILSYRDVGMRAGSDAAGSLSIVVPTLNESGNIEPLLHAVERALGPTGWEVIFVDDDSADGTAAVAKKLARHDSRVRCLHHIGRQRLDLGPRPTSLV